MAEIRVGKTAVFGRRLTIGAADQDSDDLISTLSLGDWSGGGQIEEMSGADQSRYWWGIFDGRSPRQASLPPLVSTYRPNASCVSCYPLGVTSAKALFCFVETATPKVWFFNETTDAFDYNAGAGVSITDLPVGKAVEFAGSVFIPCGANGYKIVVDSGSGVPGVTAVAGAADPTSNSPVPVTSPRPVAFCTYDSHIYALTVTGRICKSLTGANNSWTWPYHEPTTRFPAVESGTTPKRLVPFFNRSGVPAIFVTTDKGALLYNESVPSLEETAIQYPQHPDLGAAAAVWRPGEDLWIGTGLDTVHFTTANVLVPLSGLARDSGLPANYRGAIKDLEPELSCLYAIVGGVLDINTGYIYSAELQSSPVPGSGDGDFDDIRGIAVDASGNIWVGDTNNERVQKIDTSLAYVSKAGSAGNGDAAYASNDGPYDLAIDGSSNVWVVDRGNHRVKKLNSSQVYQSELGAQGYEYNAKISAAGTGDGQFDDVRGICILSTDKVIVADENNERLQRLSNVLVYEDKHGSSGTGDDQFSSNNGPYGVARDSTDRIYATDRGNHRIHRYSSTFTSFTSLISGTAWSLQATYGPTFNGLNPTPNQIAINSAGKVYIADTGNNLLLRLNSDGTYDTSITSLTGITGVCVDASDNVYVAFGSTYRKYNSALVQQWSVITGSGALKHAATDGTHLYLTQYASNTVQKVLCSTGAFVAVWGSSGTGNGQFVTPYGIVYNSTDSLVYVVDQSNSRVQVFNTAGVYQSKWTIAAGCRGIAADASGDLWVAGFSFSSLDQYTSTGTSITTISTTSPSGIGIASGDVLWVSSTTSSYITKWDEANVCDTPTGLAINRNSGRIYTCHDTQIKYWTSAGVFEGGFSSGTAGALSGANWVRVNQSDNSVYVLDSSNDRVQYFNATGGALGSFAVTSTPTGLAIHPTTSNVFVGDTADTITEYTSTGTLVRTYSLGSGTSDGQSQDLYGLEFDSTGNLFTTDLTTERVTKYTATAPVSGTGNGEFVSPTSIDINTTSGRIYVLDTGNSRVQYFTSGGTYEGKWGSVGTGDSQFTTPTQLAVNQATGDVYVVDAGNDRVQRFDATGTLLGTWGSSGTGSGQFTDATAIAINPVTGNVFVGDSTQDRVQEFTSTGIFVRALGSSGSGNGQFNSISGIAFSSAGILYVADLTNEDLQKFTSTSAGALNSYPHVQAFNGVGWHGIWEGASTAYTPTFIEVMSVPDGYRAWWGMTDGYAYTATLRRTLHNPRQGFLAGTDSFAASGYIETSESDMAMLGFKKIASHCIVFMRSATSSEYVKVWYDVDDGGWTLLGTATAPGPNAMSFVSQSMALDDGTSATISRGVPFNWIKFRLEMARGSTAQLTPLLRAFNVHFLKVPQNSSTFQFSVPLPKVMWQKRHGKDMSDALDALLEGNEMVFLRHQNRLFRGRVSQITGVDASGIDYSGVRNISFVEVQENPLA